MKKIVLLRGPQGSGKSTFVNKLRLEGHYLSLDKVREVVCGDSIGNTGYLGISQDHDVLVYAMAMESLDRRMSGGEVIVYEATMPYLQDVCSLVEKANAYGYEHLIIDFYGMDDNVLYRNNLSRDTRKHVPESARLNTLRIGRETVLPEGLNVVKVSNQTEYDKAITSVDNWLKENSQTRDLSSYKAVVHIGDLQGTIHPLLDPASPLAEGVKDDVFYIFTGDLLDRGVENDLVIKWWLENAAGRENVVLVGGNHEDHIENHYYGREIGSREYRDVTLPQVTEMFEAKDLKPIIDQIVPFVSYVWNGVEVLATHGGLARKPDNLHLVPQIILRKGSGFYSRNVDAEWGRNEKIFQVHGHRNNDMLPIRASETSFNLEGQVEFGGHLRMVVLDNNGWTPIEIRSKRYRKMHEDIMMKMNAGYKMYGNESPLLDWIKRGENIEPLDAKTLEAFENHDMVNVKASETMPHISSVSFTKSAFYSKNWDDYTTVARGLFIDNETNAIVARSFEKFFNHGERAETSDEALEQTVAWPVQGFDKINGFLCITGYCEKTESLIIASKSRIEGTFADMARKVIEEKLGAGGMEKMLRFNRDQQCSLVFEVVDMENDPHLIDYNENKLVLIGCVRRSEKFEQADYATLKAIGKWLKCDVKENLFPKITNWKALSAIMNRVENNPEWQKENPTEGVVFIDANGFQWKSKGYFYSRWKRMRGAVERIALTRRKNTNFERKRYDDIPEFSDFLDWAETLPNEALENSFGIINLRRCWFENRVEAETMGEKPKSASAVKRAEGFERAARNLAQKIAEGKESPESFRKMIEASRGDDEKMNILETVSKEFAATFL